MTARSPASAIAIISELKCGDTKDRASSAVHGSWERAVRGSAEQYTHPLVFLMVRKKKKHAFLAYLICNLRRAQGLSLTRGRPCVRPRHSRLEAWPLVSRF